MVTIAQFGKPEEAHLLRLRLGAAGIDAHVLDENLVQWYWYYTLAIGGVRVQVHEEDLEAAREVLDLPPLDMDEEVERVCPECSSSRVEPREPPLRMDFLSLLLLSFPLPFLPKTHRCSSCDHKWRSP